jgi:hypothetical protein
MIFEMNAPKELKLSTQKEIPQHYLDIDLALLHLGGTDEPNPGSEVKYSQSASHYNF